MIKITLKDGSVREVAKGSSILDVAKSISEGLARNAQCGKVNGEVKDLRTILNEDCALEICTFDSQEGKDAVRHSVSHVLAAAVKRLFPEAKIAIGPSIENGFYYDFDTEKAFTADDLVKIEDEMRKIIKENPAIERFELPRNEALELMKDEPYKVELINDLAEDEIISFYKIGDFTDLCAGPHVMSLKNIKAVKLLRSAGAYWKGDEKNKMLSRIYGTAFLKKADLDAYLEALEEERRGYVLTKTPFMSKNDLFKASGHWDHYKDGMFVLGDEEQDNEVMALRPMTCPFQFTVYNAEQHSYRDLPIRYAETSTLFRKEASGEMHGLIRVRQFTLSEGHIICTPEQLESEFKEVIDLINYVMSTLGIDGDISYRFSKWDPSNTEKYINNPEAWEATQNQMRTILDHLNIDYVEAEGEAAFYGPKLDIQFKNVHGKEDTIITVQIDFALGERLGMSYIDKDGNKKIPFVIHRSSIGCYERTIAMLIEKYAGAFPTWLAPVQVKVLPLSDKYNDYTAKVVSELRNNGIRVEADYRTEKIGYKIREARLERVPYIFVVGEKEEANNEVAVRSRKNGEEGPIALNTIVARISEEIAKKER